MLFYVCGQNLVFVSCKSTALQRFTSEISEISEINRGKPKSNEKMSIQNAKRCTTMIRRDHCSITERHRPDGGRRADRPPPRYYRTGRDGPDQCPITERHRGSRVVGLPATRCYVFT